MALLLRPARLLHSRRHIRIAVEIARELAGNFANAVAVDIASDRTAFPCGVDTDGDGGDD
jgi:hypothetical protein